MKIDKAIEILTIHGDYIPNFTEAEWQEAHKLGIEALKRVREYCTQEIHEAQELLPGETKD